MKSPAVSVLLVEDNEVDREGVRRAFARHRIENPIIDAVDGIEALEHLRGLAGRARLSRPYIVLADLNTPRMGGLELLRELRSDPELRDSVVFVFTTSCSEEDRQSADQLDVAGYILKNEVGVGSVRLIEVLGRYLQVQELSR